METYEQPDLQQARQYAFSQRALKTLPDGSKEEFSTSCGADELGELGVGIRLYFETLKYLGKLFLLVAVIFLTPIAVLAIIQSYNPDGAQLIGVQQIARAAISSFSETTPSGTQDISYKFYTATGDSALRGFDKRALTALTCGLDIAGMFVVIFGIYRLARLEKKITNEEGREVRTIGQFTIAVWGLPTDAVDRKEIAAHFDSVLQAEHGTVAKVFVGRTYGDFLADQAQLNSLKAELRELTAKAQATGKDLLVKIRKVEAKIQQVAERTEHLSEKSLPCLCAFVTLESQRGRAYLLKKYYRNGFIRLFQSQALRFRGQHALYAEPAKEPTNIVWENLQFGSISRFFRRFFALVVTFLLLLITTGFVVGATSFEKSQPPVVDCAATARSGLLPCDLMWGLNASLSNEEPVRQLVKGLGDEVDGPTCSAYISKNNIWNRNYTTFWDTQLDAPQVGSNGTDVSCAASTCYSCFCYNRGLPAYLKNTDGLRPYCRDYWSNFMLSWTLKGLSILSVLIINQLLVWVMDKLTIFERPHSRSAMELSKGLKLFLAQFINTLVVTLIVYASVPRLSRIPLLFSGPFQDFLPGWYASVGSSLFLTMVSQSVLPLVIRSFSTTAARLLASLRVGSRYTQESLNALLLGPKFTVSDRTASTLNLVFLSLALCGGLPATLYLLVLFFALSYRSDKRFLIKVARAPLMLDNTTMRRFVDILPWAVFVHFALTAWMYAALPSFVVGGITYSAPTLGDKTQQFDVPYRLRKVTFVMQLVALCVLTLGLFLRNNWEALRAVFESKKVADVTTRDTFSQTVEDHLLRGSDSYNLNENPEYAEALGHLGGVSHPAATAFLDSPLEKQPGGGQKWRDENV